MFHNLNRKLILISALVLLASSVFTFQVQARINLCNLYLDPKYEIPFEEWPIAKDYKKFSSDLGKLKKADSVRKSISSFNTFKDGYHDRYNKYLDALLETYPELNTDMAALKVALRPFYKIENKALLSFHNLLQEFSTKKKFHYLMNLPLRRWIEIEPLLDSLVGINYDDIDHMVRDEISTNGEIDQKKLTLKYGDELIWLDTVDKTQTSWRDLIEWFENAEIEAGELIVDLGSGYGRLGFLIGIVRPDVQFIGVEIADQRVKASNEIVRKSGLTNIHFEKANLKTFDLPDADHFYLFNPTHPETSEILTEKMLKLSHKKSIKVHVHYMFDSLDFIRHFQVIDSSTKTKTYTPRY